jgi:hypothetical protein
LSRKFNKKCAADVHELTEEVSEPRGNGISPDLSAKSKTAKIFDFFSPPCP